MLGFGFNKDKVRASAEKYVQQGKLQHAIAEYEKILKQDPRDLTALNTMGDLQARLGQVEKAVDCFKRVGDHYAAEGFVPKAIAMYKKLTKLSPNSIDAIQKLGEFYTQQGLYNDARAQFLAAAEAQNRNGNAGEAIRLMKRVLELDPDNTNTQTKLADFYLKHGQQEEAKTIFIGLAEGLHQRGNAAAADDVLQRLLSLDPRNQRACFLRGQIALDRGDAVAAVKHIESLPTLDSNPDALAILLRAYVQTNRLADADPVARKLLTVHNNPAGILAIAEKLLAVDAIAALNLYEEFADRLLSVDSAAISEQLRTAIPKVKDDVHALELIQRLFERAGDSSQRNELLELIAHASVQKGDLRRAADLYKTLAQLEPDNPVHAQSYRQVLTKLGEDPTLIDSPLNDTERPFISLDDDSDGPATLEVIEAPVEEDKATTKFSASAAIADYVSYGDEDDSDSTSSIVSAVPHTEGQVHEFEISADPAAFQASSVTGVPLDPAQSAAGEFQVHPAPVSGEPVQPTASVQEFDLSDEWESAVQEQSAPAKAEVSTDDLVEEIRFYIDQSMWHEAGFAFRKLTEIAPSHASIPEFRRTIEQNAGSGESISLEPIAEQSEGALDFELASPEAASEGTVTEFTLEAPTPAETDIIVPPPVEAAPAPAEHRIESLDDFVLDLESSLGEEFTLGASKPAAPRQPVAPASSFAAAAAAPAPAPVPAPSSPASSPLDDIFADTKQDAGMLDELFQEFREDVGDTGDQQEDPETHYNLGVAFKEMGLLDEAIGELQKVCQAVDRGNGFPQVIQAYTWLAHCFVEKGVPEASFKWFQKALKSAQDDETRAAIHYELASAYEGADMRKEALQHFMEVYTTNIDFRDVGERIRALKS